MNGQEVLQMNLSALENDAEVLVCLTSKSHGEARLMELANIILKRGLTSDYGSALCAAAKLAPKAAQEYRLAAFVDR